jgi:hypothetical protein
VAQIGLGYGPPGRGALPFMLPLEAPKQGIWN